MDKQDDKVETSRRARAGKSRFWRYAPLVCWMGFIFFASTGEFAPDNTSHIIGPLVRWFFPQISDAQFYRVHFTIRKAGHFAEYAVFALLAARAFINSTHDALRRRWFLFAFLLIALYSLSDEFHQSFVPTRHPSIYDSFIDMSGGLAALLLYRLWKRKKERAKFKFEEDALTRS